MQSSISALSQIKEETKVSIGIDIGIAYSRVTIFKDNKFSNIPDEAGHF